MTRQGGDGVRVIEQGWVGAVGAGPEVGAEGSRPEGMDAKLSGSEVAEGDGAEYGGDIARLAFDVV